MGARTRDRWLPGLAALRNYRRVDLASDLLAGTVVAALLVPQAMAYAMIAGLPPEVGLYASVAPLVIYAVLGGSRSLSVGPVAIVSLLVAGGLAELGPLAPSEAIGLAAAMAAAVGLVQLGMGLLRAGFLVNFISHPVVLGFTMAAALVIALSQAGPLLGVVLPRGGAPWQAVAELVARVPQAHGGALTIGALALALLVVYPRMAGRWVERRPRPEWLRALVPRAAPLLVILLATASTAALSLEERWGLAVVGVIPAGLPRLALPPLDLDTMRALLPTVLAISLVGFLESFAVAQSLAARRRESLTGDGELVALGAANLGAAVTGGYPVTGGLSRSVVNDAAGARSGVASLVTAVLVALTLAGLTPLLFHLPHAALAAVIVVAVARLVDLRAARRIWSYSHSDGAALIATFAGVFAFGVEAGIAIGVVLSGVLHLARSSQPHMAVVGRVGDTEHFRNVERHDVSTVPSVLAVRVDESLYFANARNLEQRVHQLVADRPDLRRVLLIASGINHVDATGLECLEQCAESLARAGIELHLAEVKGPVLDRLERAGFLERLGRDRLHLSTHAAMRELTSEVDHGRRAVAPL